MANPSRKMRRAAEKRAWAEQRAATRRDTRVDGTPAGLPIAAPPPTEEQDDLIAEIRGELALLKELAADAADRELQLTDDSFAQNRLLTMQHECATCGASEGAACTGTGSRDHGDLHPDRWLAAGF